MRIDPDKLVAALAKKDVSAKVRVTTQQERKAIVEVIKMADLLPSSPICRGRALLMPSGRFS